MATIIYQSNRSEFSEVSVGEFFGVCGNLYLRISGDRAFDFARNEIVSFNDWDDVAKVNAVITAKF